VRLFSSIRRKLLFWLLVIAIVPSVFTGFFGYRIGRNILEEYVHNQLSVTAKGIRNEIYSFLKLKKERVISFSSDGFIRDQTERIGHSGKVPTERGKVPTELGKVDYLMTDLSNHLIKNKVPLDVDILETFVMDMHGEVIASSKPHHITLKRPNADYFVNAKIYGVYTTDLHHCVETGEPVIEVSRLLSDKNEKSKAIGVIVNRIRGYALLDLLRRDVEDNSVILSESKLNRPKESTEFQELMQWKPSMMEDKGLMDLEFKKTPTLEQPVEIYIVNNNNHVIAGSNIPKEDILRKIVNTEQVSKFDGSGEETISIYQNHLGNQVFGVSIYIDEMDWRVLVEEDVDKALAGIKYLRDFIILMKIVTICFFVIIAIHVSRGFSVPIKRLLEGTRRLSKGKLGYRVNVLSKDEIGELAGSFNMMADSIQERTEIISKTKDYLENILQNTYDVVITTDESANIVEFNTGAEQILGYTKGEVIGKPLERFYSNRNEIKELMKRIQKEEVVKNYDTQFRSKQGEIIDMIITVSQLKDNSGSFIGTVSVGKDVIEKRKLESELRRKNIELERLSITDNLTGLYNRRHLYTELEKEMDRARRQNYPLSMILFDIDKFKRYNDTYGHQGGDVVLQKVGELVQKCTRHNVDSGYRYGGEEFIVIMPQADREMALAIAERIRISFESCKFHANMPSGSSIKKCLTMSMGIEELKTGYDTKQFIANADAAMYESKRLGGNDISTASDGFKFPHRELGSIYS
jgi:diguanylate cyclase (GGDEF)-like protein/PAS domain S-box-containing protein